MRINRGMQERVISEELSSRFKQYRIRYGITAAELAEKSTVSVGTITRFENGYDIGLLNMIKLLKALELENLFDLLIPEPPNRPPKRKGVDPMPRVKRPRKPAEKKEDSEE